MRDSSVRFSHVSYPELWDTWLEECGRERIGGHVERLKERYGVALSSGGA